jgi:NitT/TauT family transport system substrate-binding protein
MEKGRWLGRRSLRIPALVSFALLSLVVAGCAGKDGAGAGDGASDSRPIRFVMAPNFTALDALVALEEGLFEKEGLKVEMTPLFGSPELAQATISGTADISLPGASGLFATYAANRPTVGFGVSASQAAHCITVSAKAANDLKARGVTPDSPIAQRVAALQGLTISTTTAGGSVEKLVRGMMKDFNVPVSADQFTALKETAGNLAALKLNRIDATVLSPPDGLVPVQDGYGECLINFAKDDIPSIKGAYYTVYVTSRTFAQERGADLDKWTRAIAAADELIQKDPERVANSVKTYFPGVSDSVMVDSVKSVASAYAQGPQITEDGYAKAVAAYNASGAKDKISDSAKLNDVFITEHAEKAADTVFPK